MRNLILLPRLQLTFSNKFWCNHGLCITMHISHTGKFDYNLLNCFAGEPYIRTLLVSRQSSTDDNEIDEGTGETDPCLTDNVC